MGVDILVLIALAKKTAFTNLGDTKRLWNVSVEYKLFNPHCSRKVNGLSSTVGKSSVVLFFIREYPLILSNRYLIGNKRCLIGTNALISFSLPI